MLTSKMSHWMHCNYATLSMLPQRFSVQYCNVISGTGGIKFHAV